MISRRWYLVSLLALLCTLSYIDRLILTLLVEPVKAEFALSDTQMGLLIGPAFAFFFSSVALPLAWLVDRGNRKTILVSGVTLWSVCTILAGFATSFAMLFGLRMGLAVGEAVLVPVAISMIGDIFEKDERATPSAVFLASGMVGMMLAYSVGGAIIDLVSGGMLAYIPAIADLSPWRACLILVGLPGLLVAALVLFSTREPQRVDPTPVSGPAATPDDGRFGLFTSFREALQFYGAILIGGGLIGMLGHGALGWYPTHLMRTQGVSAADAGYIFSTALLGGIALLLIVPPFAERIARTGRKDLLLLFPVIQIPVGLSLFVVALLQTSLLGASIFMALGYGLLFSVSGFVFVSVSVIAPPAFRGRLSALAGFANNIIGVGLGTFFVGLLSDTAFSGPGSLSLSLLTIACVAGPAGWLLFFLAWKPYRDAMLRG